MAASAPQMEALPNCFTCKFFDTVVFCPVVIKRSRDCHVSDIALLESSAHNLYNDNVQESLADAKVSARQQCVYTSEEIYSKSMICDFLLVVNSNRGRVTYGLRDIFACRL